MSMMESWKEPGFTRRGRGRMGIMGGFGTWFGAACVILGVIGETTDSIIGLLPMSWFLVAIASLLFGLTCWMGWAVGMYLHIKDSQK